MQEQSLKTNAVKSLIWKLLERISVQVVQFLVSLVLARVLFPEDYGAITLIAVFIQIATVFVQSGFNTTLIRKPSVDELDYNTVFYFSIFVAVILYMVLFFCAPLIAKFYKIAELTLVIRVLSLMLFFGAFNSIQNAIIARNLQFRKLFISSIGAVVVSGGLGIYMAYSGFGIWALVTQQLVMQVVTCIMMLLVVKWFPKLQFSYSRLKVMFGFGSKLLVSGLTNTIYVNIYDLTIGKVFDSSSLGFYNRGKQFPAIIVDNINGSIMSVMLPVLSKIQNDKERLKQVMRKSITTSAFIIFPIMIGMICVAKPMVQILLTDKWLDCVPFLQMYCLVYMLMPIHTVNLQAFNAIGRSDVFLKVEIVKQIIGVIFLVSTIPFGLMPMMIGLIVSSLISTIISAFPSKKLLGYGYWEQLKDLCPYFIMVAIMGAAVFAISFINVNIYIELSIQIVAGVIIYITLSFVIKPQGFRNCLGAIGRK